MSVSKLRIPKICEFCNKPFEAKTVVTRYCSHNCGTKASKARKKQKQKEEERQLILEQSAGKIADIQTRPYISVSEATMLFGISKNTIHRLIKAGRIPAVNIGQRLTRVSREHLEAMFTAVEIPEKPKEEPIKLHYETDECYTIAEVSEKFGVSLSTVGGVVRKQGIPKRQVGRFVYVPKDIIDKIFAGK